MKRITALFLVLGFALSGCFHHHHHDHHCPPGQAKKGRC